MSENKDNFSELVKDKLNNFEVPYNESHWSEMSQKLDGMKPIPGNTTKIAKKFILAGAAGIVAIGAWFIIDQNKSAENVSKEELNPILIEKSSFNTNPIITHDIENKQDEGAIEPILVKTTDSVKDNEEVDNKYEKYAGFTQEKIRTKSKDYVNNIIEEQKEHYRADEQKFNRELKTKILIENQVICVGEAVQFNIDKEIDGAKYYWDFGDKGLVSRKARPKHKYKKPGTYNVKLSVAKGKIGDKNEYPVNITIVVNSTPEIKIEEVFKQITLNDPYAEFNAMSDCNCTFNWVFNSKEESNGEHVSFLIDYKGAYQIILTAKNKIGCITSYNYPYIASKGRIMDVETSFTPNGDGNNDEFLPKELKISNVEFIFIVRDKSGQLVYQTHDKYGAWNGNLNNNGNSLPVGMYFWQVSFTDDRGQVHLQDGKITLLR